MIDDVDVWTRFSKSFWFAPPLSTPQALQVAVFNCAALHFLFAKLLFDAASLFTAFHLSKVFMYPLVCIYTRVTYYCRRVNSTFSWPAPLHRGSLQTEPRYHYRAATLLQCPSSPARILLCPSYTDFPAVFRRAAIVEVFYLKSYLSRWHFIITDTVTTPHASVFQFCQFARCAEKLCRNLSLCSCSRIVIRRHLSACSLLWATWQFCLSCTAFFDKLAMRLPKSI